ncbi:hypothetical protein GCK32_015937, partial [Trichostrongylus colubriformis]
CLILAACKHSREKSESSAKILPPEFLAVWAGSPSKSPVPSSAAVGNGEWDCLRNFLYLPCVSDGVCTCLGGPPIRSRLCGAVSSDSLFCVNFCMPYICRHRSTSTSLMIDDASVSEYKY